MNLNETTDKSRGFFLWLAAILGFLSVALGAFAAHGLKERLDPSALAVFETAVRYQFFHALAILFLTTNSQFWIQRTVARICGMWSIGVLLFSGSLYALSTTGIKPFGMITPFGGVLFLVGWGMLAANAKKMTDAAEY